MFLAVKYLAQRLTPSWELIHNIPAERQALYLLSYSHQETSTQTHLPCYLELHELNLHILLLYNSLILQHQLKQRWKTMVYLYCAIAQKSVIFSHSPFHRSGLVTWQWQSWQVKRERCPWVKTQLLVTVFNNTVNTSCKNHVNNLITNQHLFLCPFQIHTHTKQSHALMNTNSACPLSYQCKLQSCNLNCQLNNGT